MATATKKKPAATSGGAEKPKHRLIEDEAADLLNGTFNDIEEAISFDSPFELQRQKVEDLRRQLAEAEAHLAALLKPVQQLRDMVKGEAFQRAAQAQPYDESLRKILSKMQTTKASYGNGGKKKPTGAVKWSDLKKNGGTDSQIETNLRNLPYSYGDERIDLDGNLQGYLRRNGVRMEPIISGKAALIKEVRRVMEIPQPVAGAPKALKNGSVAKKKSAGKSSANGKPVKRKKAAKKKVAKAATNGKPKPLPAAETATLPEGG